MRYNGIKQLCKIVCAQCAGREFVDLYTAGTRNIRSYALMGRCGAKPVPEALAPNRTGSVSAGVQGCSRTKGWSGLEPSLAPRGQALTTGRVPGIVKIIVYPF
jgi:hypothetical protein